MKFSQVVLQQALSPILARREPSLNDIENWIQVARAWLKDTGDSDEDILESLVNLLENDGRLQ